MPEKISLLARNATLRQLQVFESIARHNSFSKAAEELHLTQPTVSMQVKKLSDILEAPLFEQIGRKVHLTEAGQALYEAANNILQQLSIAEQKINHLKGFSGGSVKLTVISTAQYFVPKSFTSLPRPTRTSPSLCAWGTKRVCWNVSTRTRMTFTCSANRRKT